MRALGGVRSGAALLLALAALVGGCGVRTSPLVGAARSGAAGPAPPGLDAAADLGAERPTPPAACAADRDCGGGTVCRAPASLAPRDLEPVPLVCERPTALRAAAGAACGGRDGSACERGLCVVAGTCVAPCASAADCPSGARCAEVFARTGPGELQPVRACTPRVLAPRGVTATIDLEVARSPGGLAPVEVGIAHSATTTLALFSAPSGEALYLRTLRDPAGAVLFDLEALRPGRPAQRNPVSPAGVALTALLPSGGALALGDYGAALLSDRRATIDRAVLERATPGRVLDLDLYFVAGPLAGTPDAPGSPALDRALEAFRAFYAELGLEVGEVRPHQLVGALARQYATLEQDVDGRLPELDALFLLTAGARGPSVSWFFVRDAEGVLGVSGGVPGAQCLPGTAASGIVISAEVLGAGVPLEGVLIHETGHFLGLFHTSELDGTLLDPFDDTPSCGPDRDANGDGFLEPAECVGAGAENVMFWAATDARGLSASQRALVAHALLLR